MAKLSRNSIISNVIKSLSGKESHTQHALARHLFDSTPLEDLLDQGNETLVKGVHSMLARLKQYKSGKPAFNLATQKLSADGNACCILDIVAANKPFLFDSVMGELVSSGLDIRLVTHPTVDSVLEGSDRFARFGRDAEKDERQVRLSLIQIYFDNVEKSEQKALLGRLKGVLKAVDLAVVDWQPMLARLEQAIIDYRTNPPPIPAVEIAEAVQLLSWLRDENFTFLGMRDYIYSGGAKRGRLKRAGIKGLGILADPDVRVLKRDRQAVTITPEIRDFLLSRDPLFIAKANVKSVVHRRIYMDYIGVKLYDTRGKLSGELRIVGLFTSTAYTRSVKRIPLIRKKVEAIIEHAGYEPTSHSGKALTNVLETYPRDELFQMDVELLGEFANIVMRLGERPRVRVLPRIDKFDRYVSVLVFVPRERYNSDVRIRIGDYLVEVYKGRLSAYYPSFPDNGMARVHFIIGRSGDETPEIDHSILESVVSTIVLTWADALDDVARNAKVDITNYRGAFSAAYREAFTPAVGLEDIAYIDELNNGKSLGINFHPIERHNSGNNLAQIGLKIYHPGSSVPLSQRVPMLENLGFNVLGEHTYTVSPENSEETFIHDMVLEHSDGKDIDLVRDRERLTDCTFAVWEERTENDGFNALVLKAGANWRECFVLRSYAKYLKQLRTRFSQEYMWLALAGHTEITADLIALYHARFDPATKDRDKKQQVLVDRIEAMLEKVASMDDDRILHSFLFLINATLRTNYYQKIDTLPGTDMVPGAGLQVLAMKFDPHAIHLMPQPKPYREIFVSSPVVEGLHLRFGPVARGGLRWSDRAEDYRTEVLGLVKAQQVKNAVIVPVGSKGGFYPKQLPVGGTRDEFFEAGRSAYKIFISAMLSLTDNLVGNKISPPKRTVRYDGDDPYFVVAADKGTATFSDTANNISASHEFWLDDAFASGGSAGYDHKVMGITARGAWEAVKRHFREMDRDIQSEPFSAIGIGDMSGDVFGNGMLLSKQTRLIAAFDHRDIFIDPDPDVARSFNERERLFNVGRSSWQDYDQSTISKGGGVFSRNQKSIRLPAAAAKAIGLDQTSATPNEILNAILKMDADLLWFGGIGTYISASTESDAQVGDRANDSIRITAKEVRAKVIGEGANLGLTQRARIEFNFNGGRCNSDAIDNSAGVNSSDVEVNIKIALANAMKSGKLKRPARDRLLASMTDDVATLVLRNNYLQTLAISMSEVHGMDDLAYQTRFMQDLEERGLLDRQVELLPDDVVLMERKTAGQPLTRAETGVILAYAKIVLLDELVASDVPDMPYLHLELERYFPVKMRKKYAGEIDGHRLKREITATSLANSMINRGGPTFMTLMSDLTGASSAQIASAYVVVRDGFELQALNGEIDALDNRVSGKTQLELYQKAQDLLLDQTDWYLRNGDFSKGLEPVIAICRKNLQKLMPRVGAIMPGFIVDAIADEVADYVARNVPKELAEKISMLTIASLVSDIALVGERSKQSLLVSANALFRTTKVFRIGRIKLAAKKISTVDYYDGLALSHAMHSIDAARREIAIHALAEFPKSENPAEDWVKAHSSIAGHVQKTTTEIARSADINVARLMVAANMLTELAKA